MTAARHDVPTARATSAIAVIEGGWQRYGWQTTLAVFSLWLIGYALYQWTLDLPRWIDWDLMPITAGIVLIPTIAMSFRLDRQFRALVRLVVSRSNVVDRPALQREIDAALAQLSRRWWLGGAIAVVAIEIVALAIWLVTTDGSFLAWETWALIVVAISGGAAAGARLGSFSGYGSLVPLLQKRLVPFEAIPGHPDDLVGIRAIQRFYLAQAALVAVPIVWLSIWWIIIPFWSDPRAFIIGLGDIAKALKLSEAVQAALANPPASFNAPSRNGGYLEWRLPFIYIWVLSICFGITGIVRPFLALHKWMRDQRKTMMRRDHPVLLEQAANLRRRIIALERSASADVVEVRAVLSRTVAYADQVDTMPIWPFDAKTLVLLIVTKGFVIFAPLLIYYYGKEHGGDVAFRAPLLDWVTDQLAPVITLIAAWL